MQVDVEHRSECGAPVVGNDVVTVGVLTRLASRLTGDGFPVLDARTNH
jgi:hypothetical protein